MGRISLPLRLTFSITAALVSAGAVPAHPQQLKIEQRFIPLDRAWRLPERKLKPEFITVHSTGNEAAGANALAHARLLASTNGFASSSRLSRTGFRSWHFTVDDTRIVQHLPTDEQGDHADFTGPGNQVSLGIEICVNKDGNLERTIDRAAALIAYLMEQHQIKIDHVVPHYHWPQPPHGHRKACPAIFMEAGKPGVEWQAFQRKVAQFLR